MADQRNKPILCLDFDGVLHSYKSGWQGMKNIPDPPVEGAQDFCRRALEHFNVIIHSSRFTHEDGMLAVQAWLEKWDFPNGIGLAFRKPAAYVTLDDRAIQFTGEWPSIEKLQDFKPWHK